MVILHTLLLLTNSDSHTIEYGVGVVHLLASTTNFKSDCDGVGPTIFLLKGGNNITQKLDKFVTRNEKNKRKRIESGFLKKSTEIKVK